MDQRNKANQSELTIEKILREGMPILDKGYIRLVDHMGTDLSVVNSARVSYAKASTELSDKDERLIEFLATHEHTSPFRHTSLQFEVYAPLMVARQWWKHVVGSDHIMDAWNESSRRYITEEAEFYIPEEDQWRSRPENNKQGSGEALSEVISVKFTKELMDYIEQGEKLYEAAMAEGVCPEQARLFLPAYGMYVRWYWTASLQSVAHFIKLREDAHAQKEIRDYAEAVKVLSSVHFPIALRALLESK